jgi:serine/threonine protein kinase
MSDHARRLADGRLGRVLRRRWTLDEVLGVGGTAVVYAATHRNGSRVAIKVLHPSLQANPVVLRQFMREGYLANTVGAPEVVKVLDDDVEGDVAYLVMELLVGASLEKLRERAGGRLPAADVVEIACRLLGTLEAAHARGIVHRDIKPSNLFRTVDPLGFKVLDFGIAKIVGPRRTADDAAIGNEGLVGTPAFMAPELRRSDLEEPDERTDLWAAGATLFTLLTGERVHDHCIEIESSRSPQRHPRPLLGDHLRGVPAELAVIVERALAVEKEARFQSASAMKGALENCRRLLAAGGERSRLFAMPARLYGLPGASSFERQSARIEQTGATSEAVSVAAQNPRAGYWSGRVGRLWWFHYTGPCTDEMWSQYLGMVQRMLDTGLACTLACCAHRADGPSAVQRKQLADFVEKHRGPLARLDRFALVIDSVVHRHAITAISWLVRKPFEERIFNSPVAAIRWLSENHPELDPEAVRASFVAQVPRHSLWSGLVHEAPGTVDELDE